MTGLVDHDIFLKHEAPYAHPEHPGRLAAIRERLAADGLTARCRSVEARLATDEELTRIHTAEHVALVEETARHAHVQLDPDTYANQFSAEAARRAAGGLAELTLSVLRGELSNGFALPRPPGHHAERDYAMGFCLYNNVAVAARAAQQAGARRVAIVDWDVHHGNGTQNSFYEDPDVLYVSIHQYPFYPGTGSLEEIGSGDAMGRNVNLPYPAGMGDPEYLEAFDRLVLPIARSFAPDVVLVSSGFDAARGDLLGSMLVSPGGYAEMTARLAALASGRVVLALEGGYNLQAISASAAACLRVLLGEAPEPAEAREAGRVSEYSQRGTLRSPEPPGAAARRVLDRALSLQTRFWPL